MNSVYKNEWRKHIVALRREQNLCYRCGNPDLMLDKTLCSSCFQKKKVWGEKSKSKLKISRKEQGICHRCGKEPIKDVGYEFGVNCLKFYSDHTKRRRPEIYKETWKELFAHYGDHCVCCGESNKAFLTIDHINNDGNWHRKNEKVESGGLAFYRRVIKRGFPSDLQIMCYNCNCGKERFGGVCPHTVEGIARVKEKFGD